MSAVTARAEIARTARPAKVAARARHCFASVEILDNFEDAGAAFAEIETVARASAYQSIEFAWVWSETIGADLAISPLIVVARDEGGVATALLPLGRSRVAFLERAEFLGGRMANFQMGLFHPDYDWTSEAVATLLRRAALVARPRIDFFTFASQPERWRDTINPLTRLDCQPSPSFAYSSALPADFATWLEARFSRPSRKKLRKKAARLAAMGGFAHRRANDAEETSLMLEAFFAQKRARARELGQNDEFAKASVASFLRALAEPQAADRSIFEAHGLFAGERLVAVFGALRHERRLSGLILSHDSAPEVAAASPGELLVIEVVRDAIARGLTEFDLGVGEARYKSECCETTEPLFDSAFGVTFAGRFGAAAYLALRATKRSIKQSPRLLAFARRATRGLS